MTASNDRIELTAGMRVEVVRSGRRGKRRRVMTLVRDLGGKWETNTGAVVWPADVEKVVGLADGSQS